MKKKWFFNGKGKLAGTVCMLGGKLAYEGKKRSYTGKGKKNILQRYNDFFFEVIDSSKY